MWREIPIHLPQKSRPLPDSRNSLQDAHLAGLITIGLLLFLFEAFIPRPIPWLKIGLANVATLIALYWYGGKSALMVAFGRILIGSLFTGNFLTPGFFLSFSGGTLAALAMIAAFKSGIFGIWGISLIGAAFHNLGQILVAYFIIFKNPLILELLPWLLLYAIVSGTLVGAISYILIKRLKKEFAF